MSESEVKYTRGQVDEIILSKEDFIILVRTKKFTIDGITIKIETIL